MIIRNMFGIYFQSEFHVFWSSIYVTEDHESFQILVSKFCILFKVIFGKIRILKLETHYLNALMSKWILGVHTMYLLVTSIEYFRVSISSPSPDPPCAIPTFRTDKAKQPKGQVCTTICMFIIWKFYIFRMSLHRRAPSWFDRREWTRVTLDDLPCAIV